MVGLALLSIASAAGATTIVRFGFDSLCVRSETIALVRCVDSFPLRDDATGRIYTQTRLEVLRPIKGNPDALIVLTLPGGRLDEETTVVPGIPQFVPGEETVVFLTARDARGSPWPLGLDQGCYRARSAGPEERHVILQAGVTPLPDGALFKPASHKPFPVSLNRFIEEIERVLPGPGGRR